MGVYEPQPVPLPAEVEVAQDGEEPDGAILGGQVETALDGIRDLQLKLDPASTGVTLGITRMMGVPIAGTNCTLTGAADSSGGGLEYPTPAVLTSGAGAFSFAYMLDLPHGNEIQQARVYFYEDGTNLSAITVTVVRRDYINVNVLVGDPADCPSETVLGTGTVQTSIAGGMSYTSVGFSAHTIDRDDGADYFVRVTGTASGAGVRFMPKVRIALNATSVDTGAA